MRNLGRVWHSERQEQAEALEVPVRLFEQIW